MLVQLTLSQKSLRLSLILFILYPLFCSLEVISTILSSNTMICFSASVIQLLVPSTVFLLSVIFAIHICLLILYFFYVFVNCINCFKCFLQFFHSIFQALEHLYYDYSEFFFRQYLLFPLCLFVLVSFYLVPSFVLYFLYFHLRPPHRPPTPTHNLLHLRSPFLICQGCIHSSFWFLSPVGEVGSMVWVDLVRDDLFLCSSRRMLSFIFFSPNGKGQAMLSGIFWSVCVIPVC